MTWSINPNKSIERGVFTTPTPITWNPQIATATETNTGLPVDTRTLFQAIIYSDTNKDSAVSKKEITDKVETLNNQIKVLNMMKLFYPQAEQYFNAYIQQCEAQINTLNVIEDNFDAFSAEGNKKKIENTDLYKIIDAAQSDGNIYDFTQQDIDALA